MLAILHLGLTEQRLLELLFSVGSVSQQEPWLSSRLGLSFLHLPQFVRLLNAWIILLFPQFLFLVLY